MLRRARCEVTFAGGIYTGTSSAPVVRAIRI
jgi:hypothetical protein